MSDEKDILYDLLVKRAIYGLDENEKQKLAELDRGTADAEFSSLEMAAAAIGLADIEIEEMPAHLRSKIEAAADTHFAEAKTLVGDPGPWPPSRAAVLDTEEKATAMSWLGWLGWAAAAAAVIALAANIWLVRNQPPPQPEIVKVPVATSPTPANVAVTAEMRDDFVKTAGDLIKATWAAGNVKGITEIVGDIVWSDERQAGYMTFKNLPQNPPDQYTYQLWIMDQNQGDATPIDGGTFDVNANGEVIVPIDAKLKAKSPHLFAVTMEKPGGVVVSKREKIVAVAKAETTTKPST